MPLNNVNNLTLITLDNFTRIKDRWPVTDTTIINQLDNIKSTHSFKNFDDVFDTHSDPATQLSQQAFVHVVTETVFDYPTIFVSEKTYKPIINKRPFILVASPGCLKNLKDNGFKTFDYYWNESYDSIVDPTQRMLAIVELVNSLCHKSVQELQDICQDMAPILEYNFNYYHNNFLTNEIEKFRSSCQSNLGIR